MGKTCKVCGKPVLGPQYDLCWQCSSQSRGSMPRSFSGQSGTANNGFRGDFFPPDYLKGGYFDEKGYLRKEVIVEWPEQIAKKLAERKMTSAAIRRFFTFVKGMKNRYLADKDFDRLRPELLKLKPLVSYGVNKPNSNIAGEFQDFINRNVDLAAQSGKAFLAFVDHFEAVVAFFRGRR